MHHRRMRREVSHVWGVGQRRGFCACLGHRFSGMQNRGRRAGAGRAPNAALSVMPNSRGHGCFLAIWQRPSARLARIESQSLDRRHEWGGSPGRRTHRPASSPRGN